MSNGDPYLGKTISGRYKVVKRINRGGSGAVYRVTQIGIDVDRALKVLDPERELVDRIGKEAFRKTFQEEIKLLSEITHRNIVKILDAGLTGETGSESPYYVMELVQAPAGREQPIDLEEFFTSAGTKEVLVNILEQILDGVCYLHDRQVLHCDLKPKNILLEQKGPTEFEAKITDLGVSKSFSHDKREAHEGADNDFTYLYGSESYAPAYAHPFMNGKKRISRRDLQEEYLPHFDLFCLGTSLIKCLSSEPIPEKDRNFVKMLKSPKPNVTKILDEQDSDLLKLIALKLTCEDKTLCYRSAHALREDLRKLRAEYLWPLGIQEMAVGGAHRTITQPTEKVYLSKRAYDIISHPVFQRLQNLNQLNFVYLLYPGSRHSRFLHSLAAYEMAKRYIEGLIGDPYFKHVMGKGDYEHLLAAGLLHDIGQYPLAHALEDLRGATLNGVICTVKRDYEMAEQLLKLVPRGSKGSIADLLCQQWQIDPDRLLRIIARGPVPSQSDKLIKSMIDGAIDIDKVSYLTYDSFFSGARFGLGIDLDAFLSSLIAVPPSTSEGETRDCQLGISDKGIAPAESVIAARYSMFTRVYWHHTNRAIMAMLQYAAARVFLSSHQPFTFDDYIRETLFFSDLEAVRLLHNRLEASKSTSGNDISEFKNPLTGLLDGTRRIYKRITSFARDPHEETDHDIHKFLVSRKYEELDTIRKDLTNKLRHVLRRSLIDGDLLLDVPRVDKETDALKPLYVYRPYASKKYAGLHDISKITGAIHENFQNLVKKCRVFLSPETWAHCLENNLASEARAGIKSYLADKASKM